METDVSMETGIMCVAQGTQDDHPHAVYVTVGSVSLGTTIGGAMSPVEARKFAEEMVAAADRAEELDGPALPMQQDEPLVH